MNFDLKDGLGVEYNSANWCDRERWYYLPFFNYIPKFRLTLSN